MVGSGSTKPHGSSQAIEETINAKLDELRQGTFANSQLTSGEINEVADQLLRLLRPQAADGDAKT